MFKKLENIFRSFKSGHCVKPISSEVDNTNSSNIELDIIWEDISNSVPNSNTDSIINNAMKRNGIYGYVTSCLLITEEGKEYIPEQLSDHWMGYMCSPKFKPKKIVYHLVK